MTIVLKKVDHTRLAKGYLKQNLSAGKGMITQTTIVVFLWTLPKAVKTQRSLI
jgi:hypothetical protein